MTERVQNLTCRVFILVAALLLTTAFALYEAPGALAGQYIYKACDKSMPAPNSDASFFAVNNIGFTSTNDCPFGLVIGYQFVEGSDPMTFGGTGGFSVPRAAVPYTEATFEVAGGDTTGMVEYSFSSCIGCEPIAVIDPSEGPEFVEQSVSFNGIDRIYIQARCMALVCESVPDLRMRNFEFPALDNREPSISPPGARSDANTPSRNPVWWIGGRKVELYGWADDRESGIGQIRVILDGNLVDYQSCSQYLASTTTFAQPCGLTAHWSFDLDLSQYEDGMHTLEIEASDAVGNAAPTYTEVFYIDKTPPQQPENPRVKNPLGFNGWSHDAQFEIEFEEPADNPINFDGAPLRYLLIDLQPLSGQALDPPPVQKWPYWGPKAVQLPGEGRWRAWLWFEDQAGIRGNRAHIDLGLDFDRPTAPTLHKNEWISTDQLLAGYNQTWTSSSQPTELESGVCGFAFDVDDVFGSVPDVELDFPADADEAEVSPRVWTGRHFSHLRTVGCNGLASDVDTVQLNVDGKAPEVSAFPIQNDEWRAEQTNLTISGADDLSGVAQILYRFPGELAEVVEASRTDLPMPEGEQTVEYWAVDRAGNESERRTTTVRTDTTSPTVSFAPRSSQKPATLTAEVQDGGSGVATAWLELSEAGSGAWRQFGSSVSPNAKAHSFSRGIPENLGLLGAYEFRIVAVDRAGNRRVGTAGGGAQTLTLPVKSATALAVGLAEFVARCRTDAGESCRSTRQCPRGSSCRRARVIDRRSATAFKRTRFGDPLALVGTLSASDGTPLSGRPVEIVALPRFGVERVIETVLTDDSGAFELRLPDAPSTFYTARFAGDDTHAAQQQTVESNVRAKVSFRVSRKRIRANQIVRFSGRVYGAPEYAANGGKIVTIQFLRGRRWINTASSAQTGSAGRFSTSFSLPVVAKPTRVYFHAKVIPDGTWPFAVGSSEPISVVFIP